LLILEYEKTSCGPGVGGALLEVNTICLGDGSNARDGNGNIAALRLSVAATRTANHSRAGKGMALRASGSAFS